jgi:nucleoside 2-deoxyribosyltransferase
MEEGNPSGYGLMFEIGYALGLGKTVIFLDEQQGKYFAIAREAVDYATDRQSDAVAMLLLLVHLYD